MLFLYAKVWSFLLFISDLKPYVSGMAFIQMNKVNEREIYGGKPE